VLTEERLGERVEAAVLQDRRRAIVMLIPTESGFFAGLAESNGFGQSDV